MEKNTTIIVERCIIEDANMAFRRIIFVDPAGVRSNRYICLDILEACGYSTTGVSQQFNKYESYDLTELPGTTRLTAIVTHKDVVQWLEKKISRIPQEKRENSKVITLLNALSQNAIRYEQESTDVVKAEPVAKPEHKIMASTPKNTPSPNSSCFANFFALLSQLDDGIPLKEPVQEEKQSDESLDTKILHLAADMQRWVKKYIDEQISLLKNTVRSNGHSDLNELIQRLVSEQVKRELNSIKESEEAERQRQHTDMGEIVRQRRAEREELCRQNTEKLVKYAERNKWRAEMHEAIDELHTVMSDSGLKPGDKLTLKEADLLRSYGVEVEDDIAHSQDGTPAVYSLDEDASQISTPNVGKVPCL